MRGKILIIDDEPRILEMLTRALEVRGYQVITAQEGLEGVEMAKTNAPDLIITDLMMPKVDGHTVCQLLKSEESYKDIPIIMMTSSAEEEDKEWAKKTGADIFINKPISFPELFNIIKEFIPEK